MLLLLHFKIGIDYKCTPTALRLKVLLSCDQVGRSLTVKNKFPLSHIFLKIQGVVLQFLFKGTICMAASLTTSFQSHSQKMEQTY